MLSCVLVDGGCGVCLWVEVRADEEHDRNCVWICERDYHLSPLSTHMTVVVERMK